LGGVVAGGKFERRSYIKKLAATFDNSANSNIGARNKQI